MTEDEIRAQIKAEIFDGLKFETFRKASIVNAICVTVIVDDGKNPAQAVCRFYLPNGVFVGEVPANKIIMSENAVQAF